MKRVIFALCAFALLGLSSCAEQNINAPDNATELGSYGRSIPSVRGE